MLFTPVVVGAIDIRLIGRARDILKALATNLKRKRRRVQMIVPFPLSNSSTAFATAIFLCLANTRPVYTVISILSGYRILAPCNAYALHAKCDLTGVSMASTCFTTSALANAALEVP